MDARARKESELEKRDWQVAVNDRKFDPKCGPLTSST